MTRQQGRRNSVVDITPREGHTMGNHRVRTTQRPDKVLTVDDAEFVDLQRQGLLVEDEPKGGKADKPAKPTSGSAKGGSNTAAIEGDATGDADTDENKGAGE